jgi:hypothetical protein
MVKTVVGDGLNIPPFILIRSSSECYEKGRRRTPFFMESTGAIQLNSSFIPGEKMLVQ